MFLDRSARPGELTITIDRDAYLGLLRRAAESGLTPQAFVERLTRDAYGRALAGSLEDDGRYGSAAPGASGAPNSEA